MDVQDTFGKKSKRKRPKVASTDLESLLASVDKSTSTEHRDMAASIVVWRDT